MEKLNRRIETFSQALESFNESIELHREYSLEEEKIFKATRDSVIQRFEYSTDLLWKILKIFLEDFEKITLTSVSPRNIIRDAVASRIISEKEGQICQNIISKRNETSHIYHEEVAEDIMEDIPEFYTTMLAILGRIKERITY